MLPLGPDLLCLWLPLPCAPVATGAPATQAAMPPPRPVLTGAGPSAPGQPREQSPVDGPHTEVGLKPKLSLRGRVTKEEEQKSFHAAAQTED